MMRCPTLEQLPVPPPGRSGWPWSKGSPQLPDVLPNGRPWPRISIVTPSFNQGQFIEETIRSVLLQGYPDLEYTIIDGGSTDNSVEIIKKYEPWLTYWVSERDHGHAHALNKGFGHASGEIMAWLNSDDYYLPNAFRVVAEVLTRFPEIAWLTSVVPGSVPGFSRRFFQVGGYMGLPYSTGWIQQESTFWRSSVWQKSGAQMDESYSLAIDFELWSRFFQIVPLVTVNQLLGVFRVREDQRSRANPLIYRTEAMRAIRLDRPIRLATLARIYKRLRLYKLLRWRHVVKLMYGERTIMITNQNGRDWMKKSLWVA